jgi:hypothetical protein
MIAPRFLFTKLFCLALASCSATVFAATGAGPDAFGYTAAATTFAFEDLTNPSVPSTGILEVTDDATVSIPIGFPFTYYGVTYTTVTVSTNGILTFGGADASHTAININTNTTLADLPTICVFWHDWTFAYTGTDEALYATLGTPGNRRLIVQWDFVVAALPSPSVDTVTFQVKLFEGTNNIEFHYDDATVSDDVSVSNGKATTVGIRDTHGQGATNRALQWSFNQAVIQDGAAIKYIAPQFRVNAISRISTTQVLLDCTGAPSRINHVQATTSLGTAFTNLANVTATANGHFTYTDSNAGAAVPKRFYRVTSP